MPKFRSKARLYAHLSANAASIVAEAVRAAGLDRKKSGEKEHLPIDSCTDAPPDQILSELSEAVKAVMGDDYDVCPFSSKEYALRACCQVAFTAEDGGNYTYLMPLALDPLLHVSLGTPFPPHYKYLSMGSVRGTNRSPVSGLRAAVVPLQGALYPLHGIRYGETVFASRTDPDGTMQTISAAAEVHSANLTGILSPGQDTPGSGMGVKHDGVPVILSGLGELAEEYDIPLVVDAGTGVPFLGQSPRKIKTSYVIFRLPVKGQCTLVVGPESPLAHLKRWMGLPLPNQPVRGGESYYGTAVPNPTALREALALLQSIRDNPERFFRAVDLTLDVITQEFSDLDASFKRCLALTRSYSGLSVEINYEDTWKDGIGFPVFSPEDDRSGTNLIQECIDSLGIKRIRSRGPNLYVSPWNPSMTGSLKPVNEEKLREDVRAVSALFKSIGNQVGITS